MIIKIKKQNSGFIALISAIILSAVLLLVATNLSFTGFLDRSNILDSELKKRSYALAEACADTAILKVINNPLYLGNEIVSVSGDPCLIQTVTSGNPTTILTKADYKNYVTKLAIKINPTTLVISCWEEFANLSTCP
jgi:hypothetical protein